jgi:hypothetical protein
VLTTNTFALRGQHKPLASPLYTEEENEMQEKMTIGEKYGPAMAITDQEKANAYFEQLVEHTMKYALDDKYKTREAAEQVERSNLGYYAGYYSAGTRERVERLFLCQHPIFGAIR